jgi:hypothetical protein
MGLRFFIIYSDACKRQESCRKNPFDSYRMEK